MRHRVPLAAVEVGVPLVVLIGLGIWAENAGSFFFPPFGDIAEAFDDQWLPEGLVDHAVPSLYRFAAGYLVAVALGVTGGAVVASSWHAARIAGPVIEFLRAIPAPAMIPFFIVVLGLGDLSKIMLIGVVCAWPVLLNTVDGLSGVDRTLLDTGRVYGVEPWQRFLHLRLPAASPQIFAGMRTSLSLALILMVISEMVGSTNGIGYSILESQSTFDIPSMWAGIVLLGILGYVLNFLFDRLEGFVLRWHRGLRGSVSG